MSYTNSTEFYGIPLPEETDLVNPMDDNDAKERIDTDLHSAVQNASSAVETANSASDAAAAATSGLEELSGIVNTEKGKLTALTARVTAAENEIDDVRGDNEDMICAYNEPTATSTHAYSIGDFFIYNDVLYKATAAITIGDTIVPNTNCSATNVTTEVDAINTALSGKADDDVLETVISRNTLSTQGNTVDLPNGTKLVVIEIHDTTGTVMASMVVPKAMLATEIAFYPNAGGDSNYTLAATIQYSSGTFTLSSITQVGWTFADVVIAFIK